MNPIIQSKLPNAGATIFTIMSVLANEHSAINLGQGFPDYDMNEALVALVNKAMQDGYNQYVHSNGLPLLRERISEKVQRLYATSINPIDEITITPGGTYALYPLLLPYYNQAMK
jgi:methionine transaminase